ncbi:hypothetical protein HAX54_039840 [Datura stramonium]|uniref:Histone H2B n=1 Tax=Datura stramonium TaxID=4076 RepID=A0ABS8SJP7_DATST|nr:hypothetical protein [Datura stramonium]
MAPKADKKPAAEKAPSAGAEKSKAGKKLPKDAGDKKKKRAKKSIETCQDLHLQGAEAGNPPGLLGTTRSPPLHGRFKPPSGWSSR